MAMIVQNLPKPLDTGSILTRSFQIQGDSAYPLGGYPCTAGTFGYTTALLGVMVTERTILNQNYTVWLDRTYGTLRWFTKPATPTAAIVELATGTSLLGTEMWVVVTGF